MQASRSSTKQAPKWGRGMSFSLDSSEPKPSKPLKPSLKSASSLEKQLQEELIKAKEERKHALQDLEEMKKSKITTMPLPAAGNLEKEVEKAKESERKMLESLIAQTKQLEQTKISLEEAKLEIKSLRHSVECFEGAKSISKTGFVKSHSDRHFVKLHDPFQMDVIAKELKLATAAEEKSKKAMDGLALALKEVSTEANQAKARLSTSQTQLERVKSEAEKSKSMLKSTEEKLQTAEEEIKRLKSEAEDLTTTWNEKENVFKDCMRVSEEEISHLKQENSKLAESLRVSREDYSKLRDILKHAVNESTVLKETLEMTRSENSKLQDLLSEKENAYQSIRQEYECLKVSEAAAVDSVKELKGFLAATSNIDCTKESTRTEIVPSEESTVQNVKGNSIGGSARVMGSLYDPYGPSMESREQVFGTASNVSDSTVPSSIYTYDELKHIERSPSLGDMHFRESAVEQKKKKPILKRFGDMIRRKSFRK